MPLALSTVSGDLPVLESSDYIKITCTSPGVFSLLMVIKYKFQVVATNASYGVSRRRMQVYGIRHQKIPIHLFRPDLTLTLLGLATPIV